MDVIEVAGPGFVTVSWGAAAGSATCCGAVSGCGAL